MSDIIDTITAIYGLVNLTAAYYSYEELQKNPNANSTDVFKKTMAKMGHMGYFDKNHDLLKQDQFIGSVMTFPGSYIGALTSKVQNFFSNFEKQDFHKILENVMQYK